MNPTPFSREILIFHGRQAPEPGYIVGYGALIDHYSLPLPYPAMLALIIHKNKRYDADGWIVRGPALKPPDTLLSQLTFALKYEGINLLFFKKLFEKLSQEDVLKLLRQQPTGRYSRSIWFLYEWLMNEQLPLPDIGIKNYVPIIDEDLQFATGTAVKSSRHRILNNLPGNRDFCPLIRKTGRLQELLARDLPYTTQQVINGTGRDLLLRASAFLLLKDSKASFTIEGERPSQNRAVRWGKAIGQAGNIPLGRAEFERLQQIVIESSRFMKMGYRQEGGFIGEHDRETGEPVPEHISACWQDLDKLMGGLITASGQLVTDKFPPVLAAAAIAFGFVFIHPFVDGNGRLHRYLIHHILAAMRFSPQGIVFPVSAAILLRIDDYRKVLEEYSHPLLDFIQWRKTDSNNIEVLNDTIDYYQYFDATAQAEFLYECVDYTARVMVPEEVDYLQNRDRMKSWLDDHFEMPDKMTSLIISFLAQGGGKLSKRFREKELASLTDEEAALIESFYTGCFADTAEANRSSF